MATPDVRSTPLLHQDSMRHRTAMQTDKVRDIRETHESGQIEVPTEETAFISNTTLVELIDPHNLNDAQLQDIYQHRIDDFEAPSELEVWYMQKGKPVKEYLFVDPLHSDERPRLCVSVKAVQAMHRAIAVLSRKVDNLVLTLRSCRHHYHKELCLLRELVHRREAGKDKIINEDGTTSYADHVTFFFNPSKYQDEVTIELFKRRIDEATYEMEQKLSMKNTEIRKLHQKIDKMESGISALDKHDAKDLEELIADLTDELDHVKLERDTQEQQLEENSRTMVDLQAKIDDLKEEIGLARGLVDKKEDKYNRAMEREHKEKVTLEKLLEQEREENRQRWEVERAIVEGEKSDMEDRIKELTEKLAEAHSSSESLKAKLARTLEINEGANSAISFARSPTPSPSPSPIPSRSNSPAPSRSPSRKADSADDIDDSDGSEGEKPYTSVRSDAEVQELLAKRKTTLKEDLSTHLEVLTEKRNTLANMEPVNMPALEALDAEIKVVEAVEKKNHENELQEIEQLWEQVYKKPVPSLEIPIPKAHKSPRSRTPVSPRTARTPTKVSRKPPEEKQPPEEKEPLPSMEDYSKLEPTELYKRLMMIASAMGEAAPTACLDAVHALLGHMMHEDLVELQDFLNARNPKTLDDEMKALMKRPFGTPSPRHTETPSPTILGNESSSAPQNAKADFKASDVGSQIEGTQQAPSLQEAEVNSHPEPTPQEIVPGDELLAKWGKGIGSQPTTAQSTGIGVLSEFPDSRGRDALNSAASFALGLGSRGSVLGSAGSLGTGLDGSDLDSRNALEFGLDSKGRDALVSRDSCNKNVIYESTSSTSPARLAALLNDERLGPRNNLSRSASMPMIPVQSVQQEDYKWDGENPPLLGSDGKVLVRRKTLPAGLFKKTIRSRPKAFSPKKRQPKRRLSLGPCWSAPMHLDVSSYTWGTGLGRLTLSQKELPTRHNQVTTELLNAGWTLYDPGGRCYSIMDDVNFERRQTRDSKNTQSVEKPFLHKAFEAGWSPLALPESGAQISSVAGLDVSESLSPALFPRGPSGMMSARERRRSSVIQSIASNPHRRKMAGQALAILKKSSSDSFPPLLDMSIVGQGHDDHATTITPRKSRPEVNPENTPRRQTVNKEGTHLKDAPLLDMSIVGHGQGEVHPEITPRRLTVNKDPNTSNESRLSFRYTSNESSPHPKRSLLQSRSSSVSVNELSLGGLALNPASSKQQEGDGKGMMVEKRKKTVSIGTQTNMSVHLSHFEVLPDKDFPASWRGTSTSAEKEALRRQIAKELIMLCLEMREFVGADSTEAPSLAHAVEELLRRQSVDQQGNQSSSYSNFLFADGLGLGFGVQGRQTTTSRNSANMPKVGARQHQPLPQGGIGGIQGQGDRQVNQAVRKRVLSHPSGTSPISEIEDEEKRSPVSGSTRRMTTDSHEVCSCGATFTGDVQFCKRCGARRPVQTVSQDMCVCGSLLKPDALFCRKCGLSRAEISKRSYNLGVPAAKSSKNVQSTSSLAFSDTDILENEGLGSQATLSTAPSASSFRGLFEMKTVESAENLIRVDGFISTSLCADTQPVLKNTDKDDAANGKQAGASSGLAGAAFSAKTLVTVERNPPSRKSTQLAEVPNDNFGNIIDAMLEGTRENSTSKHHLMPMDESIVERSKAFLQHDRRASGRAPLEPRPQGRPQTQRQPRLKPLESPFAEQDLSKWNPEASRTGVSTLPLKALLNKR